MQLPKALYELEYNHGAEYGHEEEAAVLEVLRASAPSCGPKVKEFEDAFAAFCGTTYGVTCTNATSGLELAMIACGVGPGDEVITTPISWISTANAAAARGANVVFADIDPITLNIDPASVERKITARTKAILIVHLYGHPCDMDALISIAKRHNILLVEDCAHAAGAEYKGRRTGSLGDIGVFSFHQQKNITTLGEGGLITTSNKKLYETMLSYRSLCCLTYDPKGKYLPIDERVLPMGLRYWMLDFNEVGYNHRMTDMQAAVGLVQLGKLPLLNAKRSALAKTYTERLSNIPGLTLPAVSQYVKHTWHVYCVMVEPEFKLSKEEFMWEMYVNRRIKVWNHYMPIHLTTAYRNQGHHEGECPVAESMFKKYVSLPIHPRITEEALDYMMRNIRELA